jgi:hypothetical protein
MKIESLADQAVSALATIKQIESQLDGINDYGESTGFCDDRDRLVSDFFASLDSLQSRASLLKRRIRMNKKE